MSETGGTERSWKDLLDEQDRRDGTTYFRLAYGLLCDADAAREVVQEAFLKAWEQRTEIRDSRSLRGWLSRVIVNECFRRLRRRQTRQRVLEDRAQWGRDGEGPADVAERRDLVVAALAQLPEPTRTVVTLRVMQELSGNEVSELLELSPSEVSRRLHEGLDRLRRFLSSSQFTGED